MLSKGDNTMTTNKIFIFSLMMMLVVFLAMYINKPAINASMVNMNITLSDDLWIGIALFINYLLIGSALGPKPSRLSTYNPQPSKNF